MNNSTLPDMARSGLLVRVFLLLLLISHAAGIAAAPAVISGATSGRVTEDVDPDGDNLLETGGQLNVVDPDAGESYFTPTLVRGRYGSLYINSWGTWSYALKNDLAVVQNLSAFQYLQDVLPVTSIDGTRRNVVIYIIGVDEVGNTPAVIGGTNSGSVTKNVDPDGNGMLEADGLLTVSDPDAGEASFKAFLYRGDYGVLYIDALGAWHYAGNNGHAVIQNLSATESLQDSFAVSTVDGTVGNVVITIRGADAGAGGISIRWAAPAEREDGSPIAMSQIAGYRVYYGRTQGSYPNEVAINSGSTMNATLSGLGSGTYYIVVTAVDSDGRESGFSQEIIRHL